MEIKQDLGLGLDTNCEVLDNYEIPQNLSVIIYEMHLKWFTLPLSLPLLISFLLFLNNSLSKSLSGSEQSL